MPRRLTLAAGIALAVLPLPRTLRYRIRLGHPGWARVADRVAEATLPALVALTIAAAALAASPRLPAHLDRFWLAGAALGLLSGVPFAAERRRWRRRLAEVGLPPDPCAPYLAAPDGDPAWEALVAGDRASARARAREVAAADPASSRRAALIAAAAGDGALARLLARRAARLDGSRWEVLSATAAAVCRRGRFRDAVQLAEEAVELSRGAPAAVYTLAQVLAASGRLREAVASLDRGGASLPRGGEA